MKKFFDKLSVSGLFMFAITMICGIFGVFGVDAMLAAAPAVTTTDVISQPEGEYGDDSLGGNGVMGEGLQTLDQALSASPNLVTRAIHNEVIKIAPYDYTARSLLAKNFRIVKKTKDHKIGVYSSSTGAIKVTLAEAYAGGDDQVALNFGTDNKLFAINETVYFPGIKVYKDVDQTIPGTHCLICYVVDIESSTKKPVLKVLNGTASEDGVMVIPPLPANTLALRGVRTGTETQIRTQPINVLPTDKEYYVQKNIIEFGSSGWFDSSTKEVKWDDTDRMEMAMAEKIRTSMPDFWLGAKNTARIQTQYNSGEELAFFAEGLWYQAGREINFNGVVDINALIELGRFVFEGNRSSNTKYFVMGSQLSAAMQKVIFENPVFLGETYKDNELNINFTAVNFFGGKKILFTDDPSLDDIGMADCGFIIDHKYAFEYQYEMMSIPFDGKKLATSDVKGQSIVEENCFILANNDAHCRVILGEVVEEPAEDGGTGGDSGGTGGDSGGTGGDSGGTGGDSGGTGGD